jgi:hypothetical protein
MLQLKINDTFIIDCTDDIDERQIIDHITNRKEAGQKVCLRVLIQSSDLDFSLTNCPSGSSRTRKPTPKEREIIDLWNKFGLNDDDFGPGEVVAFTKQTRKLCR